MMVFSLACDDSAASIPTSMQERWGTVIVDPQQASENQVETIRQALLRSVGELTDAVASRFPSAATSTGTCGVEARVSRPTTIDAHSILSAPFYGVHGFTKAFTGKDKLNANYPCLLPTEETPTYLTAFRNRITPLSMYVGVGTERTLFGALAVNAGFVLQLDVEPSVVQFNALNSTLLAAAESQSDYRRLRWEAGSYKLYRGWMATLAPFDHDPRLPHCRARRRRAHRRGNSRSTGRRP